MTELTNLLTDPWICVRRRSGREQTITPSQVTEGIDDDPIVDIVAPRPDFRSALYQFLIGLLQTAHMPDDDYRWIDAWNAPPTPEELAKSLDPFHPAFMVAGDGPMFMQDLSVRDQGIASIGALLIDEPGASSAKFNKDHFVKRSRVQGLSLAHAISALITMQSMAPAGGAGHRTSLRGGGPLTTLLLPGPGESDLLWHRLWLNVLDQEAWALVPGKKNLPLVGPEIFPWMGCTRISDREGIRTTPEDVHSLQHYWSMPRRILLGDSLIGEERCLFSQSNQIVTEYSSRPWGANYDGAWRHPLSPYYKDKSNNFLPLHPQPGGFVYQLWVDWAHPPVEDNPSMLCAKVISNHLQSDVRSSKSVRLWASGYDMDNMKPRCFYDVVWPLFRFPSARAASARNVVVALAEIAEGVVRITRLQIKEALLRRPGDHSDSANNMIGGIASHIYETSESQFFDLVAQVHSFCVGETDDPVDGKSWLDDLSRIAHDIFDAYVPIESIANADPARIARARNKLFTSLYGKKNQAHIDDIANAMADIHFRGGSE